MKIKINKFFIYTDSNGFEIHVTVTEDDKTEKEIFALEFNKILKRKQYKLTKEVAEWMKTRIGSKRKITTKGLKAKVDKSKSISLNSIYQTWYDCSYHKNIGYRGVFILWRVSDNKEIDDNDFRVSLAKALFRFEGKSPDNALYWLGDYRYTKIDSKLKEEPKSKLIQVPIFTEESNQYVRFAVESEKIDFDLLTASNGFHISLPKKEDKQYLEYFNEREEYSDFLKCLEQGNNILVTGPLKIGKTRLVYQCLKNQSNYCVFSLQQLAIEKIDKIKLSENLDPRRKIVWFIDDLNYFLGIEDNLWKMYEKLVSRLGKVTVISTVRSDKDVEDKTQLTQYMKRINIPYWDEEEIESLAKKYKKPLPESRKYSGIPFSVIGDMDEMRALYDKKVATRCKWVLRYLKLLQEFIQHVEYNLLEKVYVHLKDEYSKYDTFEKCLIKLESVGFIERSQKIVFSWELYLEEIITNEDYPNMDYDMDRLIDAFIQHKLFEELKSLGIYFAVINNYESCVICHKKIVENITDKEAFLSKSIAYYNWGNALFILSKNYDKDEKLLREACEKYEKAIKYRTDYYQAYYSLGSIFYKLAKLNTYDEKMLINACNNFEKAIKYKKGHYPEAYYVWGSVLDKYATLTNDKQKKEDALSLLFSSLLFYILQRKWDEISPISRTIIFKAKELNDKICPAILTIISIALVVIRKVSKPSSKEIELLKKAEGKMKETDIIINALLYGISADYINVSNELLLKTAVFLADNVIDTYEKNKKLRPSLSK